MFRKYHNHSKLTKAHRESIQRIANPSFSKVANVLGVFRQAISKWWKRAVGNDKLLKRDNIKYFLAEERKTWFRDIHSDHKYTLAELHNFSVKIGLKVSESTIYRCVRGSIKAIQKVLESFKQYESGFIHIGTTYLPKIGNRKNYLFVAINRAFRILLTYNYSNKSVASAFDFLDKFTEFFLFKIRIILIDNVLEFSNRIYRSKNGKSAKKVHLFSVKCSEYNIEQRFPKVCGPQTNGNAERVIRTIKETTIYKNCYGSVAELNARLLVLLCFTIWNASIVGLQKRLVCGHLWWLFHFGLIKNQNYFITNQIFSKKKC